MSDVGGMVAELIAAGCAPDVAAEVVARAFIAGVSSADFRGQSADVQAEKRREKDRERKRIERESLRKSADVRGNPQMSKIASTLSKIDNNSLDASPKSVRGQRLPDDWQPKAEDLAEAARKLGDVEPELAKFRDYWKAQPGQRGVKVDWDATFRNWIRNARAGPQPISVATEKITMDAAVAQFAKFGRWSKHAPVSDISQVPAELLAKHGLAPDGRKLREIA